MLLLIIVPFSEGHYYCNFGTNGIAVGWNVAVVVWWVLERGERWAEC